MLNNNQLEIGGMYKMTRKKPKKKKTKQKKNQWQHSDVFIANFENIFTMGR